MYYSLKPPKGLYFYPKDLRKITRCSTKDWRKALKLSEVEIIDGFPLTDKQAFKLLLRIRQVQGESASLRHNAQY